VRRTPWWLLVGALLLALAPSASATDERKLRRELSRAMARAGAASGAYVENLTTGARIYARRAGVDRIPASNEKLWTAAAALEELGPTAFFRTTALAAAPIAPDGTLNGHLYLRGEGDPTLSGARLEVLAQELADLGLARVRGRVVGDDTAFDRRRGPFGRGIGADVGGPLGALVVDRAGGDDPAAHAAEVLARELRDAGVKVSLRTRTGATPAAAEPLAFRGSASVALLIRAMNVPSDNYVAEMLLKALTPMGTTRHGAAAAARIAQEVFGATPTIRDGSGLSRADATTPLELVGLLEQLVDDEAFYGSLAVMGESGTLEDRLERSRARGRCRGKTGTLSDVSALSGYCETAGGDLVAYSFLMNRVYVPTARDLQDRMVSALARYE
jgi:serine-type D-Ala-D-Ala carboxypeptidase/endopeptidase (penicillin-binding protein 4)